MKVSIGKVGDKYSIPVCQGTPLGNPFKMRSEADRDAVCDKYEAWFQKQVETYNVALIGSLKALYIRGVKPEGVVLGCYCAPKRCHAETIKRFLESASPDFLQRSSYDR